MSRWYNPSPVLKKNNLLINYFPVILLHFSAVPFVSGWRFRVNWLPTKFSNTLKVEISRLF